MQDFRKLQVWEKAHRLTLEIYKVTEKFPKSELYALTNQIRRAASSIPTNIAEGCVQESDTQYARYLQIALGSASEVEYQLLLSKDLNYLDEVTYQVLNQNITEIKRMLTAFIRKLKA